MSARDVEALAKEAERGYDLGRARRVRVGRPSLGRKGAFRLASKSGSIRSLTKRSAGEPRRASIGQRPGSDGVT